jgi:hypothetical protein
MKVGLREGSINVRKNTKKKLLKVIKMAAKYLKKYM